MRAGRKVSRNSSRGALEVSSPRPKPPAAWDRAAAKRKPRAASKWVWRHSEERGYRKRIVIQCDTKSHT